MKLGAATLNGDLNDPIGYAIMIRNNDTTVSPTIDAFEWFVNDTQVAALYGLHHITVGFRLIDDTSSSAFNNTALLNSINLNKFNYCDLQITGAKSANSIDLTGFLHAQIISLTPVQ